MFRRPTVHKKIDLDEIRRLSKLANVKLANSIDIKPRKKKNEESEEEKVVVVKEESSESSPRSVHTRKSFDRHSGSTKKPASSM